jgi:hypothetical protein
MLTVKLCNPGWWRIVPALASNAAGWQFHWLLLYVEWRRDA